MHSFFPLWEDPSVLANEKTEVILKLMIPIRCVQIKGISVKWKSNKAWEDHMTWWRSQFLDTGRSKIQSFWLTLNWQKPHGKLSAIIIYRNFLEAWTTWSNSPITQHNQIETSWLLSGSALSPFIASSRSHGKGRLTTHCFLLQQ